MEMSTNKIINGKNNDVISLSKINYVKLAGTTISGWLREMDGENTEEDWAIHTTHSKLDGQNSSPSFKKIFKHSPSTIYHYR